ncbi:hypothetical protein AMATHDRAFT_50360 [Amanita thiersii Skay4041]|uniref:Uncharacterized protein n=1 Tax=Amanita thiersii Skay4041 TaxID=703135 RepID=A0A2A9NGJ1_9AGAR|nr:hypothetical protein AMATHDRAFT_50360 [Amanita thiersii Skay4041]
MIDGNQDLAMFFLDAFVNILITAGVKDGRERICEEIESRFSSEIENIVKKSQELNKAIGEDVTSCELEILYMEPDHVFDESIMEDTFQDQTKDTTQEPEGVLCTTDLGLIRHEKTTGGDGWQNTILIKPKIVLQSKLDAIIASDDEN